MSFVDKQLTCRDCSNTFLFTGGEQEFYASKGLQNEPVRCPPCRSARKSNRLTEPEDGYVKYGVFASFGGRTPRQMHPATCADCGMMTEVPFQPRGDRPVYCSTCYNKIKGAAEAEAEAAETAAHVRAAAGSGDAATEAEAASAGADGTPEAEESSAEASEDAEAEPAVAEDAPADEDAEAEAEPAVAEDAPVDAEAEAEPAVAEETPAEDAEAEAGEVEDEEEKVESVAEAT